MNETKTSNFIERFKTLPVALAIFLLGFSIVYLSHGPRISDPDGWYYYRVAKWIAEEGIPEVDLLQYYPTGGRPREGYTLHAYFIGYGYKLVKPLGISFMDYLMLFPAVVGGGLAAVALYFAIGAIFDKRTGLFASLLYSFMPLSLSRVYSGTIDKEIVYGFFVYSSLYFFARAYKDGISLERPRSLFAPVLAGISFALVYGTWSGGGYILWVLSLSALIHLVFDRNLEMMKALLLLSLAGPAAMHLIQPSKFTLDYFKWNYVILAPLALSSFTLFSMTMPVYLRNYKQDINPQQVFFASIAAAFALVLGFGKLAVIQNFIGAAMGMIALEKGAQSDLYMATVAESQPSRFLGPGDTLFQQITSGDIYPHLGALFFIIPIGLFLFLNRFRKDPKDFPSVFALVWLGSGFLAANQGFRLLFFLAPSAATVSGFAFAWLFDALKSREKEVAQLLRSSSKAKIKERVESKAAKVKVAHVVWLFVALAVSLSTLELAVASMNRQSDLPAPWYEALMWTKNNTPEDSVILFWWDYGYYFQAVAERRTIADGGGNVPVNINLANMFSSPEDEAVKYIKKYVDYDRTTTYLLVSYEEFGKSGAINRIAGGDPETYRTRFENGRMKDGQLYIGNFQVPRTGNLAEDEKAIANTLARNRISTYYIVNAGNAYLVWALVQFDQNGNYHPAWSDKLLAKLLPFNTGYGQGLKHFELVYQDQWNYILIYRVK